MNYSAIILCAGSGKRTGLGYSKMFFKLNGETVYEKSVKAFLNDERCKQIIIVSKMEEREDFKNLLNEERMVFVNGGKERQDSVFEGLKAVNQDYVMIHDGARPYVSQELLDRIVDTLSSCDACLPMVKCKDTIKRVVDGKVVNTLKREELYQAQTPQSFKTALIIKAHDYAKVHQVSVTDDASMVEIMGENVYVVEGDYDNIKITTKEDLR